MWFLVGLWACVSAGEPVAPRAPVDVAEVARAPLPEGWLERVIGADDPDAELPLVVMVHGRGDVPASMIGLLEGMTGPVRVVAPRAPDPLGDGFTWFPISVRDGQPQVLAEAIGEQADALVAQLAEVQRARPTRGKPVLSGFSQGGMLSFAVAVRHPDAIAKAVPVAGWLPEPMWPGEAPPGAPPIRALHGLDDDVLPFAPTAEGVEALRARGWDASLQAFPGVAHRIPAPVRASLYAELR